MKWIAFRRRVGAFFDLKLGYPKEFPVQIRMITPPVSKAALINLADSYPAPISYFSEDQAAAMASDDLQCILGPLENGWLSAVTRQQHVKVDLLREFREVFKRTSSASVEFISRKLKKGQIADPEFICMAFENPQLLLQFITRPRQQEENTVCMKCGLNDRDGSAIFISKLPYEVLEAIDHDRFQALVMQG